MKGKRPCHKKVCKGGEKKRRGSKGNKLPDVKRRHGEGWLKAKGKKNPKTLNIKGESCLYRARGLNQRKPNRRSKKVEYWTWDPLLLEKQRFRGGGVLRLEKLEKIKGEAGLPKRGKRFVR